jgi:hypothetical protein
MIARSRVQGSLGEGGRNVLGYVIAAYGIVIGSLVAYALWIRSERRKLMARGERNPDDSRRI